MESEVKEDKWSYCYWRRRNFNVVVVCNGHYTESLVEGLVKAILSIFYLQSLFCDFFFTLFYQINTIKVLFFDEIDLVLLY